MPTPLKSGQLLRRRYKILRIIGQGGMGCIYLTDDNRLRGRNCAIKEVEYDRSLGKEVIKESRQQFLKEATILARLDHPNLPKVSDYFSIGSKDYLVMDYIPGDDLRMLITKARQHKKFLKVKDVLLWSQQIADALIYLHSQTPPILHRDIKPGNLKITPDGYIKLVDFGLVKLLAPGERTVTIIQGQGTAYYTPLEQYGGDSSHTDVRSDIYAFGATLYHLLTNTPPTDARERFLNPKSMLPVRQINPAVNPQIERTVHWAISLHPNDRPSTMKALKESLVGKESEFDQSNFLIQRIWEIFQTPMDRKLLMAAIGLTLISFLVVLLS